MRSNSRDGDAAWVALTEAARLRRNGALTVRADFGVDSSGALARLSVRGTAASLRWDPCSGWALGPSATAALTELADLYLPVINASARQPLLVAHLGQSLDGYVATASGKSHYVNGPENLVHLHRMRALSDAVLVGAGTVASDNPRLTTRLVTGDNPQRVVLDPSGRLSVNCHVFTDGAAPTWVVRAAGAPDCAENGFGQAELLTVPATEGRLDLRALLDVLHARGLHALFVEGGGVTVSLFLTAGLLDRLQIAVAPLLIGEGRPGVRVPGSKALGDCLRPSCRVHPMGDDVLFDCDLRCEGRASAAAGETHTL